MLTRSLSDWLPHFNRRRLPWKKNRFVECEIFNAPHRLNYSALSSETSRAIGWEWWGSRINYTSGATSHPNRTYRFTLMFSSLKHMAPDESSDKTLFSSEREKHRKDFQRNRSVNTKRSKEHLSISSLGGAIVASADDASVIDVLLCLQIDKLKVWHLTTRLSRDNTKASKSMFRFISRGTFKSRRKVKFAAREKLA